jgi:hypothetical protein
MTVLQNASVGARNAITERLHVQSDKARDDKQGEEEIAQQSVPAKPAPAGDTEASLCFLDTWTTRHDLAAIDPDLPKAPGKIECATFHFPNEREKAKRWIEAWQGKRNLYVSVNRAREDAPRNKRLNHKKEKEIGLIRAITADIDIPKLECDDLNEQRQHFERLKTKLLKEVAPKIAELECRPTFVVDSGGGVQLWWILAQTIPATPENAAQTEGVGRAISEMLQADFPEYKLDNVSDLARVMRLPGTINIPDETKRKRGRSAALAAPIFESCRTYSLNELAEWAPPTAKRQSKSSEDEKNWVWPDMGLVKAAGDYEELPDELRKKFESARDLDSALRDVWNGDEFRGRKDDSGSGAAWALSGRLKRDGQFTVTEFGQLLWVWEHGYDLEKIDARTIARDWNRHREKGPSAGGFDPNHCAKTENKAEENKAAEDLWGDKQEWEDPTDFWTGESEPPDLPDGVVPEIVERFARDRGRSLGVEAGAPAACLLAALASGIPASNFLQMRQKNPHWTVKAINWTAIIGDSGSNKSATLSSAMGPLEDLESHWEKEWMKDKRDYEENERAIKEAKARGEPAPEPLPRPQYRTKIIRNSTIEGAALLLSENHDGLFFHLDELAGLLGAMDLYRAKGGGDRPFWLQAKQGGPYSMHRRTSEPIRVKHCAVSILGAIQPDKMRQLAPGLTDDGLLQRFLPVYLKRIDHGVDTDPDKELDKTVAELALVLSQIEIGRFKFTPEADSELRRIQDFEQRQRERSEGPKFREFLAKLPDEFGRLALAIHCIRWASLPKEKREMQPQLPTTDDVWTAQGTSQPPGMISLETAAMARRFLEEFIFPHAREFYRSMLDQSPSEGHATWIGEYILSRGLRMISRGEIQKNYKALKDPSKTGLLSYGMAFLETHSWVRPVWTKKDGTPTTWEVSPKVNDGRFKEIADRERSRRETERSRIAQGRSRLATTDDTPTASDGRLLRAK